MELEIITAIKAQIPAMAQSFEGMVLRTHQAITSRHGATLAGIFNSRDIFAYRSIAHCLNQMPDGKTAIEVCPRKCAAAAYAYAEASALELAQKVIAKVEELTDVEVVRLEGYTFTINGKRNGQQVAIIQNMILNCSSRGILFNQFPAHIYINGKRISENKYKAHFA